MSPMSSADSYVGPPLGFGDHPGGVAVLARLNRLERAVIVAMSHESLACRYHGRDWDKLGWEHGLPRCDSCKQPYRRTQLLLAAGGVVPDA
jgi:hypothetical protein